VVVADYAETWKTVKQAFLFGIEPGKIFVVRVYATCGRDSRS
jgi:hypothetical protein